MDETRQIHFMQIRMVRFFAGRWNKTFSETAEFLCKKGVFRYIADFFEILHTEGDIAIAADIEKYLSSKGAALN